MRADQVTLLERIDSVPLIARLRYPMFRMDDLPNLGSRGVMDEEIARADMNAAADEIERLRRLLRCCQPGIAAVDLGEGVTINIALYEPADARR